MSLALLIVLVVVQYAPAPLKEVIRKYHSINHTLKKSYCCGFKLLRRKPTNLNQFLNPYPIVGVDCDEHHNIYVVICDHSPCRNSNAEVEYTLGSLCLDNRLSREALNLMRPYSYYDSFRKNPTTKCMIPNYNGIVNNGCRYNSQLKTFIF